MQDQDLENILVTILQSQANGMIPDECWADVVPEATTFYGRIYHDALVLTHDKGLAL